MTTPTTAATDSAPGPTATQLVRPHLGGLAAVVVLQAIGAVAGLVPLLAVVELGRHLLGPGPVDPDRVRLIVTVGAIGLLLKALFTVASSGVGHLLDGDVQLAFRRALAAHLGRVPITWLSRRRTGELAKVVGGDVSAVHPFIAHSPAAIVSAFVIPLVSLVYLLTINWRLSLVTLIPVVIALSLIPLLMTPSRLREQEDVDEGMGRISNSAIEFVQGISVIKTFGGDTRAHRTFLADVENFVDSFSRMVRGLAGPAAGMQLVLSPPFVLLTVLVGGAVLIVNDGMPAADLLPFLLLGLGLTAPVEALANHQLEDAQSAWRAVGRIRGLLGIRTVPEPSRPVAPEGHRVELVDVRFGYEPDHEVLRGIDLALEPGSFTAVVGPSGGGKSTMAQLLPRFFDPTQGSVRLGGVDLRDMSSRDLYGSVSVVLQDVRLLRLSIADNIALAVPSADREDVVRAAQLASIHDRILELPHGYDTVLGDETTLSGGEGQRLSIARALLADTPIVVMDEATAFADPLTELAVNRALATLKGSRTLLVIAHRLETITEADSVVMLDGGSIAEQGRPSDLLGQDGQFAAFWRSHREMSVHGETTNPHLLQGVDPR